MQVEICGTVQVVPDNFDLSNKPWVKVINKTKKIKQGDKIQIGYARDMYIVTLIPKNPYDLSEDWYAHAICLISGTRYDDGHLVKSEDWPEFPMPDNWIV